MNTCRESIDSNHFTYYTTTNPIANYIIHVKYFSLTEYQQEKYFALAALEG